MSGLNESPSEKEGKLKVIDGAGVIVGLNESPSEKEGKSVHGQWARVRADASMKVPPKRKGNGHRWFRRCCFHLASMKVPPKRKGN